MQKGRVHASFQLSRPVPAALHCLLFNFHSHSSPAQMPRCLLQPQGWHKTAEREEFAKGLVLEVVALFGADRCMFASNFPVRGTLLAAAPRCCSLLLLPAAAPCCCSPLLLPAAPPRCSSLLLLPAAALLLTASACRQLLAACEQLSAACRCSPQLLTHRQLVEPGRLTLSRPTG